MYRRGFDRQKTHDRTQYLTQNVRVLGEYGFVRSDRLLAILLLLQTRGRCTAPDLAERLEVSVRTIYRDIEALSSAGVPVYTEQGRHGGVRLIAGYRTDATGLTAGEAQALFTFSGRAATGDAATDAHLRAAFRKLLAALPVEQRPAAERGEQRILVEPQGWGRRTETGDFLDVLQQAVVEGRSVFLRYRRPGRPPAEYVVHPVGLVAKAGVWYLVACRDGEPRTYRSGRIEHAETRGPAELPLDLPPLAELWVSMRAAYERPGTGVVVEVRAPHDVTDYLIGGTAADVVAEPTQRRDPDHDDHDLVRLTFHSISHARAILLGHHDRIEILSPDELIAEFAAAGRALTQRYG